MFVHLVRTAAVVVLIGGQSVLGCRCWQLLLKGGEGEYLV